MADEPVPETEMKDINLDDKKEDEPSIAVGDFESFQPQLLELSPELLARAEKELNEKPTSRVLSLWELKQRLATDNMLKKLPLGSKEQNDIDSLNVLLMAFLRTSKFDEDRAYNRVKRFIEIADKTRFHWKAYNVRTLRHLLETEIFTFLPKRDILGRKVVVFRSRYLDEFRYAFKDISKLLQWVLRKIILEEETQISGISLVMDLTGGRLTHFFGDKLVFESEVSSLFEMLQECFPLRIRSILILRQPWYVNAAFAIFKPFMKQKMKDRVVMAGDDTEKLFGLIKKEDVPEEMGGTLEWSWNDQLAEWYEERGIEFRPREFIKLELEDAEDHRKDTLGMNIKTENHCALVTKVESGTISEKLGVKRGDVIFKLNDYSVYCVPDIFPAKNNKKAGMSALVRRYVPKNRVDAQPAKGKDKA